MGIGEVYLMIGWLCEVTNRELCWVASKVCLVVTGKVCLVQ